MIAGDIGVNMLRGGAGNDSIDGLGASDVLLGDDGDDILETRDGIADARIDCGEGLGDFVRYESLDIPRLFNCEQQSTT